MPFTIVRNDISQMSADAVVLPSNEALVIDGAAGLAIGKRAGLWRLRRAVKKIGHCTTGSAVYTNAYRFPARYLIHAVGPVWPAEGEDTHDAQDLLRNAYDSALSLAAELGCTSVALPLISAGTFGCPSHISLDIALDAVSALLAERDMDVTIVLYGRDDIAAGLAEFDEIATYIDDAYVEEMRRRELSAPAWQDYGDYGGDPWSDQGQRGSAPSMAPTPPTWSSNRRYAAPPASSGRQATPPAAAAPPAAAPSSKPSGGLFSKRRTDSAQVMGAREDAVRSADEAAAPGAAVGSASALFGSVPRQESLEKLLASLDEGFSATLLKLIDARGLTDANVYNRANISRQLFAKIRKDPGYRPTKRTALSFAVALELSVEETDDLLERAGLALSGADKFDVIVKFYIERGIYDMNRINTMLYAYDQQLLGSAVAPD